MPQSPSQQNASAAVWEPQAAESRLAQTVGASPSGVFTSDLSVSEYVLLGEAGFEPLGFVVGSSIYHVGLQIARWGRNQELQVLTQAMYNARECAMARMRAEADHLAADGIVGVQLRMQMYSWGQSCLEFVATGTAVRHLAGQRAHLAPDGRAFTSDLSAQDFYRLLAVGAVPVAFVLGTCVYHIAHPRGWGRTSRCSHPFPSDVTRCAPGPRASGPMSARTGNQAPTASGPPRRRR
jgi:uncharacterized protein YbjQ (UPF0145 family)